VCAAYFHVLIQVNGSEFGTTGQSQSLKVHSEDKLRTVAYRLSSRGIGQGATLRNELDAEYETKLTPSGRRSHQAFQQICAAIGKRYDHRAEDHPCQGWTAGACQASAMSAKLAR
jgi:hypothetical protein